MKVSHHCINIAFSIVVTLNNKSKSEVFRIENIYCYQFSDKIYNDEIPLCTKDACGKDAYVKPGL